MVSTQSIVARPGASIPAPFAIPPTVQPSACVTTACLATVSVVRIASAASAPPSAVSAGDAASTPASSRSIGSRSPIRPVEQTATSPAPMPQAVGDALGGQVGVGEPGRPGAGVRAAGVQHDGAQPAVGDDLARPQHGRRLDPVRREHRGGDVGRTVVDDEGEVEPARP